MSWFQSGATVARPIGFPIGFEEKPKPGNDGVVGRSAKAGGIT